MLSFSNNFLQKYILLAKILFLVSISLFRRISNALNSYFWVSNNKLNVSIQPFWYFVGIGNHSFSLCVTTTTGLLLVGWFIQSPIILTKVACYKRAQSNCIFVTSFYRIVGDLTTTLVQNFIFNSMDLIIQSSFRVIVDHKRLRCNRLSVS